MSGKGNGLLVLGMLLLAAAGALLPQGAGLLQDRALEAQTDSRTLDGVRLTLRQDGEVRQALAALAAPHTEIILREGAGLTQDEAETAARRAVTLLIQERLLPGPDMEKMNAAMTARLVIPTASDDRTVMVFPEEQQEETAVIWDCMFTGAGRESYRVRLDDATGKLISVSYDEGGCADTFVEQERTTRLTLAERWAAFFQDYFSAASSTVRDNSGRGTDGIFGLDFSWEQEGNGISLTLEMTGESISFW